MPPRHLQAALEALLFSSDQPLPLALLVESLDVTPEEVMQGLGGLEAAYAEREAGVQLREIAGGWVLVTAPEHAEWVSRLLRGKKKMRLSRAALETMAIIAYKQPVTKSEIEAIRGVDATGVLATLIERNLVTIRGRSKVVGRPLLYGTTSEFLDYFGLKDLTELPRPEELKALVAAREPEQMELSDLEVMAEAASGLPAGSPVTGSPGAEHETSDEADEHFRIDGDVERDDEDEEEFEDEEDEDAQEDEEADEDEETDDDDDADEERARSETVGTRGT
ncbi:MAG: SMC-Scp complex subunit ScpB [Candidatus Eisenbacteria bacterium]|uniref:SMC-Scp complex subunit ScpB n=1 Tax=Eiseniibacteriota bacterium TaxID=2212470 RepID=A0A849SRF7_UNCEI|nr:SMC-Scp complex subunit ScpB [Candidatus Eisenbacteria bacterium]